MFSKAEFGKFIAAQYALKYIQPNMKLGLGTGSTAEWLIRILAHAQRRGLSFRACATSSNTVDLAESLGIKINSLDALGQLDLAIDGADEFDQHFNMIKGGGGALLREKIIESTTDKLVIIADQSKQKNALGGFPLPVEIVPFSWQTTVGKINHLLAHSDVAQRKITRRMTKPAGNIPFISDEGHFILDLHLGKIGDIYKLSSSLSNIVGVVETGLFLNMADVIVVGSADAVTRVYKKNAPIEIFSYDKEYQQHIMHRMLMN